MEGMWGLARCGQIRERTSAGQGEQDTRALERSQVKHRGEREQMEAGGLERGASGEEVVGVRGDGHPRESGRTWPVGRRHLGDIQGSGLGGRLGQGGREGCAGCWREA